MVIAALSTPETTDDRSPRRPATVPSIDARLSVWGQAARDAVGRRADILVEGAAAYVERVGRNAEVLRPSGADAQTALLSAENDLLVPVAANLIPAAVRRSSRLLWVDPEKLRANLLDALAPALESVRTEIRRRQALYRRRARLWQHDIVRLNRLRDEVESLRIPRTDLRAVPAIERGLLLRHREDAELGDAQPTQPEEHAKLRVRAGSISRWLDQIGGEVAG